jgi:hypothetical protein
MLTKEEEHNLLHGDFCRWCGKRIFYNSGYRSIKTGGRIPLSFEDKQSPHKCLSFEAVKAFSSEK